MMMMMMMMMIVKFKHKQMPYAVHLVKCTVGRVCSGTYTSV